MFSSIEKILSLVLVFFIIAAAIIAAATRYRHSTSPSPSELWRLYYSELLIVTAVLIPAYLGGIYFLLAILVFNLRSHIEVAHIHGIKFTDPVTLSSLTTTTAALCIFSVSGDNLWLVISIQFAILGLFLLILTVMLTRQLTRYIPSLLLICLVLLSLSALIVIGNMPNGSILIIFLFVMSETNDAFALIFGKIMGRHKILAKISPNKTLEGLAFGVLFSATAGLLYNQYILDYPLAAVIPMILIIISSVITGDIIFSVYKRCYKVKDFKEIISNQGGVLDIYDSLLVSGLIFYIILVCKHGF